MSSGAPGAVRAARARAAGGGRRAAGAGEMGREGSGSPRGRGGWARGGEREEEGGQEGCRRLAPTCRVTLCGRKMGQAGKL